MAQRPVFRAAFGGGARPAAAGDRRGARYALGGGCELALAVT